MESTSQTPNILVETRLTRDSEATECVIVSEEAAFDYICSRFIAPPISSSTSTAASATENEGKRKRGKKQRVSFLQVRSCIDYRKPVGLTRALQKFQGEGFILNVPLCVDCFKLYQQYEHAYKSDSTCRFRQTEMRRLQHHEEDILEPDGQRTTHHYLKVADPVTEVSHPFPRSALYHMEPAQSNTVISKSIAEYVLRHAARPLLQVLLEEQGYFSADERAYGGAMVKRLPAGCREWCNVCQTSIFNLHYMCLDCGFIVCGPCRQRWDQAGTVSEAIKYINGVRMKIPCQRDGWPACCSNLPRAVPSSPASAGLLTRQDFLHNLHATRMIPSQAVEEMEARCQKLLQNESATAASVQAGSVLSGSAVPAIGRHIVRIPAGEEATVAMERFRTEWSKDDPVVVEGMQQRLAHPAIWRPEWFAERFAGQSVTMVDCLKRPQEELTTATHDDFWKGFTSYSERLKNKDGEARLLKIKDWLTHSTFKEQLPEHHADLMRALPLNDYTHAAGPLNLATYIPHHFGPADLGPRMCIVYGAAGQPELATTNLHMEMSDTVNVIVHVAKPISDESRINTKDELVKLSVDDATRQRIEDPQQVPGAVWQVFRAVDAPRIADWLRKEQRGRRPLPVGCERPDPIHSQETFLDREKRRRLFRDTGVEGFDIVQFEGDAIFIPAGAPHQVWNVNSCITVGQDVVSPEHLSYCVQLTKQFSQLPVGFHNKHDKLQIKNILFQAVKTLAQVEQHTTASGHLDPPEATGEAYPAENEPGAVTGAAGLAHAADLEVLAEEGQYDSAEFPTPPEERQTQFCDLCDTHIKLSRSNNWILHINSDIHTKKVKELRQINCECGLAFGTKRALSDHRRRSQCGHAEGPVTKLKRRPRPPPVERNLRPRRF